MGLDVQMGLTAEKQLSTFFGKPSVTVLSWMSSGGITGPVPFGLDDTEFIELARHVGRSTQAMLLEPNDTVTREKYVQLCLGFSSPVFSGIKVVCDDSNNTPRHVDKNEIVLTVHAKLALPNFEKVICHFEFTIHPPRLSV